MSERVSEPARGRSASDRPDLGQATVGADEPGHEPDNGGHADRYTDLYKDLYGPGRILVISCYELGHTPHGLAMPQAFLRRAGFAPACVDLSVQALERAAIERARLIFISVPMHNALRMGARVIERIRARNPDAGIGCFGLYAPLNRDYLRTLGVRWVLAGECEDELVAIAENLATGKTGYRPSAPIRLGKLAFARPHRAELPAVRRYARFDPGDGQTVQCGYAETTRGCLDTCRHCPVPAVYGGRFFVIDADVVLADIAAQVEGGARHITFGDPDFLNGPGHSMAVLRRMHARWPDLSFDITTQVSHLRKHAALMPELVELGCAFVISAVESLSDRVLDKLGKRHRRADFEHVLSLARSAGLVIRPTLVTFTPWTELADMRELIDFIVAEDIIDHIDPVQLTIRLLVPPGSLLLAAEDTRAAFGALDADALTHVWRHRDPRVDALQRELAELVAGAVADGRASGDTLAAIRAAIYGAVDERVPTDGLAARVRERVPRVTEPWFC